ncbi:hypothetical protein HGI47_20260 [Novosphingobium sp. ERN07]|nr:hypothetical protein [Novosphingobium sp. ERN07]
MNLAFSAEQRQFADGLERFCEKRYAFENRRRMVAAGQWGEPLTWTALAEMGCFGIAVAEAAGGFGGGAIEIGLMLRTLGRFLAIEPVVTAVVAGTLLSAASDAEDHIAALIEGEKRYAACFGLSDVDGRISGQVRNLSGAWGADHILAATDAGLFLIDAGVVVMTPVPLLDDTVGADFMLDAVPAVQLATGPDWSWHRNLAVARNVMARGWQAWGAMEGAVAATSEYMRTRQQFGRALGTFQTVQHRVAEMIVAAKEAESAALLGALVLEAAGPGPEAQRALAAMTARVAAAAAIVAETAVQLHGGMGVSDELDIAARFRHLQAYRLLADAEFRPTEQYIAHALDFQRHRHSALLIEG